jgi:hypothetical protein
MGILRDIFGDVTLGRLELAEKELVEQSATVRREVIEAFRNQHPSDSDDEFKRRLEAESGFIEEVVRRALEVLRPDLQERIRMWRWVRRNW